MNWGFRPALKAAKANKPCGITEMETKLYLNHSKELHIRKNRRKRTTKDRFLLREKKHIGW